MSIDLDHPEPDLRTKASFRRLLTGANVSIAPGDSDRRTAQFLIVKDLFGHLTAFVRSRAKRKLIERIGTGIHFSKLPQDDATIDALADCMDEGLVMSKPAADGEEFFWLTEAGQKWL